MSRQFRRSALWPDRRVGPREDLFVVADRSHGLRPTRAWLPRIEGTAVGSSAAPPVRELAQEYKPAVHTSNTAVRLAGVSRFGKGIEWQASGDGGQGLDCGADTDLLPTAANCTVIVAKRFTGAINKGGTFGVADQPSDSGVRRCGASCPFSDGIVYWDYGGFAAGTSRLSVGGLTFGDDIWAFTVGARGMEIWQNSIKVASNAGGVTRTASAGSFYVGAGNDQLAFFRTDNCVISLLFVYHYQLPESAIVSICNDPFQWLQPVRPRWALKAAHASYSVSLADTQSLSDTLALAVGLSLPDALVLGDGLAQSGQFAGHVQDALALGDLVQVASRRMHGGAATDWRNPARLAQTLWAPRGSCACGLGHVGPQGCNAEIGADVGMDLTLSDTLLVESIGGYLDGTRLLTTGFEEGESISHLTPSFTINSVLFANFVADGSSPPEIVTDITHTGTYAMRLLSGGPSAGFSDKLRKAINPTLPMPASFGFSLYAYFKTGDISPFNRTSDIAVIQPGSFSQTHDTDAFCLGWAAAGDATHVKLMIRKGRFATPQVIGTVSLSTGQWYRMEIYATVNADGSYVCTGKVYSDDATTPLETLTFSGGAGGYNVANAIAWFIFTPTQGINPSACDLRIDDVAVFSRAGPYGPRHVVIAIPNSTIVAQWTPEIGAPSNLAAIDDLPSTWAGLDGQYNDAFAVGKLDKFGIPNPIPVGQRLLFVDVIMNGGPSSGNGMTLSLFDSGGSEIQGPNMRNDGTILPLTGLDGGHLPVTFPGSSAGALTGAAVGYRTTSPQNAGNPQRLIHRLWANVEYAS